MSSPEISFEFFPPRTEEQEVVLRNTLDQLNALNPAYFSVTFGAGGSTRDHTLKTALGIQQQSGRQVAPHISCIGSNEENIRTLLDEYKKAGISQLIALRGDMPSGMAAAGYFRHANELVDFITSHYDFHVHVACYPEFHPESFSAEEDIKHFKQKIDAGANSAITQYFFNADAYFRFIEDTHHAGIEVPITPGIMPISNYTQLKRFSTMCGAEMPRWIEKRLQGFGDDRSAIQEFGAEIITKLCEDLLRGGAPGLHFYTLNRAKTTLRIVENLGISCD